MINRPCRCVNQQRHQTGTPKALRVCQDGPRQQGTVRAPADGPLPETTTVANLKYYAEQGLIPHVLAALTTPKLKVTGTRLLADYAKQADRRKAVAGS